MRLFFFPTEEGWKANVEEHAGEVEHDPPRLRGRALGCVGAVAIGSLTMGRFSPHLNLGYSVSGDVNGVEQPDELSTAIGFDLAILKREHERLGRAWSRPRTPPPGCTPTTPTSTAPQTREAMGKRTISSGTTPGACR